MAGVKKKDNSKFEIDYANAIAGFENAIQKFPVKKILYRIIFRGKGLEFDSYRNFESDDDASMIDWKASLRSNTLLAKKYIEERDLNIYFLVDISNSMLFGSKKKLKAEYAAEMIASLSHLMINSGDRVGLIMFDDGVMKFVPPSSNRNQFAIIAHHLSDSKLYGGGFDIENSIDYVLRTVKSSYTVFIIVSDFIKIKKSVEKNLKLIGSRFETMAIMVRDPMDENLPDTKYQLAIQDPYSNRQLIVDPSIASKRYKANVARQKEKLKHIFRRSDIDFLELNTDKNFFVPVASFLRSRALGTRL